MNGIAEAIELTEAAEQMLRARYRREQPEITEEDLEAKIIAWYHTRPGAEFGDAEGTPGRWPR